MEAFCKSIYHFANIRRFTIMLMPIAFVTLNNKAFCQGNIDTVNRAKASNEERHVSQDLHFSIGGLAIASGGTMTTDKDAFITRSTGMTLKFLYLDNITIPLKSTNIINNMIATRDYGDLLIKANFFEGITYFFVTRQQEELFKKKLQQPIAVDQAQDGWVDYKADNRISVKFPSAPKELTPGSFMSASKDSTTIYIFTLVDFVKVAGIDSVALAPVKATPEFAAQLKVGMKQSLPDVDLADFKIGTWKGFTSYTSTGLDSKRKQYDMFMIIIGNKLYSLSTVIADGASLQGRDDYFASIILSN